MGLKTFIRLLKTSPLLAPVLALIDAFLFAIDITAVWSAGRVRTRNRTLVIFRLDMLGDYLVHRRYLAHLQTSPRYRDYTVTLVGNLAFRELVERLDADVVDRFVWVDIYRLATRPGYRFRVVRALRQEGFAVAFCPAYSRVLVLDDYLAWATGAPERVGCRTDCTNSKRWEAWLGDRLYTRLLETGGGILFEMERNRRVMEQFLGEPVAAEKPSLERGRLPATPISGPYIVLSLGASQAGRVWPMACFAEVVRHLWKDYPDYAIVLTGTNSERTYARLLLNSLPASPQLLDRTGQLSMLELIAVLANARLLLANETGVVHLAAAVGTLTIALSQGRSLVRWHPYPPGLADSIHYLYPDYIEQRRDALADLAPQFNPESPYRMEDITPERVIAKLRQVLPAPPQRMTK